MFSHKSGSGCSRFRWTRPEDIHKSESDFGRGRLLHVWVHGQRVQGVHTNLDLGVVQFAQRRPSKE